MQPETEDFWLSYLRTPAAVQEQDIAVRAAVHASAQQAIAHNLREIEAFQRFLLPATAEVKERCTPFLDFAPATVALVQIWKACEASTTNSEECHEAFRQKLLLDDETKQQLRMLQIMIDEQSEELQKSEEKRHAAAEIAVTLQAAAKAAEVRRSRTWRDVPEDELAERLSKGEVIGRDEWVPGLTGDKRDLGVPDARGHLEFGARIREEGNQLFSEKKHADALLRYIQGVNLVNWVKCSKNEEIQHEIEQLHLKFQRNLAQAALLCGEWQQAKGACREALALDEHDEKSLFRLAKAHLALGELTDAKASALRLLKSPFVTADGVTAGKAILQELRDATSKWKSDIGRIVTKAQEANTFSSDRKALPKPAVVTTEEQRYREQRRPLHKIEMRPAPLFPVIDGETGLTREKAIQLAEELLEFYTSAEMQGKLNQVRAAADFDERKILIRARAILQPLLEPLLDAWAFSGETFAEKKKAMEREILYWRARDETVRSLATEVYNVFMGDFAD